MKYFIRFIAGLVILIAVACVLLIKPLDTAHYTACSFYSKTMQGVAAIKANNDTLAVQAGWAKVNLLPPFTTPIAIDDARGGKHFEGVHDSIYVRAFVFKQGKTKVAFVSADLLIIPPSVTTMFDTMLQGLGFNTSNIFFTATHSHASIGAWQNSYVGKIFAGKFDERVPKHIAAQIAEAIMLAEKNVGPVKIGYSGVPAYQLTYNRLVGDSGRVDSLVRFVKLEKPGGETACIVTFSAHATVYHERMMHITRDWPGVLIDSLENSGNVNFACFAAGAVGSHGPFNKYEEQEQEADYIGGGVAKSVNYCFDSVALSSVNHLQMEHIPLYLREPNVRLSNSLVLRPWVFYKLFGGYKVYINALKLGDVLFIGTPCDYSGELMYDLNVKNNDKLLVTSFNGGYIGYVTDDKWYNLPAYETKTMAWFGPGNGSYITHVINAIVERM